MRNNPKYGIIRGERVIVMNISGVASAASGVGAAGVQYMASLKVMDMAQEAFKDAAEELLRAMDALITGLGQNIDILV